MRQVAAVMTLVAVMAFARGARGQTADSTRLFKEGYADIKAGKWDEGCKKMRESYELEAAPGTALNLGACADHEGKPSAAWTFYDKAAQDYARDGRAGPEKAAREFANALLSRLATVEITLADPAVPDMEVAIGDKKEAPAAKLVEHYDANRRVTVTVTAPGRRVFSGTVDAEVGRTVQIKVPVLDKTEVGAGPGTISPPVTHPEPRDDRARHRSRGWRIAAIAGAGATAAFGATYLFSWSQLAKTGKRSGGFFNAEYGASCDGVDEPSQCEHGQLYKKLVVGGELAAGASLAFTALATYLWLRSGSRVVVTPSVSAEHAAASLSFSW